MQNCMDWRSIKFDWNRARAFLVTAEEGSLSAAARALGLTQPTLGRQVAALEEELGAVLFERVGTGLVLTPTGAQLMDHVRAMGEAATRLSVSASGQSSEVDGTIRISATDSFCAFVLPGIIATLRETAPGITVELEASNTVADLRRREADIAIRSARPSDPDLFARKVMDAEARLYATPDLLARLGHPACNADLANAPFIGFDSNAQYIAELRRRGIELSPANFPLVTENHIVHWNCARQGIGIAIMETGIAAADADMVEAAPWLDGFPFPLWLVTHRELHTSRRVRLVFDHLADSITAQAAARSS